MEFERSLFQVYDRCLDTVEIDTQGTATAARTNTCKFGEKIVLIFALLFLSALVVLHVSFVGQPGCLVDLLNNDLRLKQQLQWQQKEYKYQHNNSTNVITNASFPSVAAVPSSSSSWPYVVNFEVIRTSSLFQLLPNQILHIKIQNEVFHDVLEGVDNTGASGGMGLYGAAGVTADVAAGMEETKGSDSDRVGDRDGTNDIELRRQWLRGLRSSKKKDKKKSKRKSDSSSSESSQDSTSTNTSTSASNSNSNIGDDSSTNTSSNNNSSTTNTTDRNATATATAIGTSTENSGRVHRHPERVGDDDGDDDWLMAMPVSAYDDSTPYDYAFSTTPALLLIPDNVLQLLSSSESEYDNSLHNDNSGGNSNSSASSVSRSAGGTGAGAGVDILNITMQGSACFGPLPLQQLIALGGMDTVVLNAVMFSTGQGGVLRSSVFDRYEWRAQDTGPAVFRQALPAWEKYRTIINSDSISNNEDHSRSTTNTNTSTYITIVSTNSSSGGTAIWSLPPPPSLPLPWIRGLETTEAVLYIVLLGCVDLAYYVGRKLGILVLSLGAFCYLSTMTALAIRVILSSFVLLVFPLFFGLQMLGCALPTRVVYLAYPWLGGPLALYALQGRPTMPFYLAHFTKCVLYYSLYVAGQTYISQLFYDQLVPGTRELLLFSIMMM